MIYKLGRNPRRFNPRIPHMSSMLGAVDLPPVPDSVDWTKGITNFGMMLNDQLGCCTCAAVFHARQIWTANTLTEQTESDNMVLELYEQACNYQPGNPSTDEGGVEQNVLSFLLNTGIPLTNGTRDKIVAFFEVDPRNTTDIKRTIDECGLAYIGFEIPNNIFDPNTGMPLTMWSVDHANPGIEGGHAVVAVAYDASTVTVISWGSLYKMTWEFFTTYTEEAYAIVDNSWVTSTGKTPLGLTIPELESMMEAVKN